MRQRRDFVGFAGAVTPGGTVLDLLKQLKTTGVKDGLNRTTALTGRPGPLFAGVAGGDEKI